MTEYPITDRWLLLVAAAIIIVLLFFWGLKNGFGTVSGCAPVYGYLCSNAILYSSGILNISLGQSVANQLSNVSVYFVPRGGNLSNAASASIGNLTKGKKAIALLQLPIGYPYPDMYAVGTPVTGSFYLSFSQSGSLKTIKVATLATKVRAYAYSAFMPTKVSGIVAYVPVIITNNQAIASSAPFQQIVRFSESNYSNYLVYNGSFANFEFFYANGTIIPAWIESSNNGLLTVWLNLSSGVPASNSIIIYLGFASKTTNLLSAFGPTGEAPQLSQEYAAYDDGTRVFLDYFNMANNPISSNYYGKFTKAFGIGPTGNVQPLLAWSGSKGNELAFIDLPSTLPSNFIITGWIKTNKYPWDIGLGSGSTTVGRWSGYVVDPGEGNNANFAIWKTAGSAWSDEIAAVGYSMTPSTWYTLQYAYVSPGNITGWLEPFVNTLDESSPAIRVSAIDTTYTSFNAVELAPYSLVPSYTTYWALIAVRSYPPNGIMPSVSFRSISALWQ